ALAVLQAVAPALIFAGSSSVGQILAGEDTRTLITPAGWAFSIWGVIYLGSIAFGVYQLVRRRSPLVRRTGFWPAAAFALSVAWLLAARAGLLWATVVVIAGLLATLLVTAGRIAQERTPGAHGELWLA